MTRDGSEGLCRILVSHLSPWGHQPHTCQPERLDILCLRSAAVYATTALYEYHANSQHNQQHDQGKYVSTDWLIQAFFLTDIEKTQGKNNSPNSITQGNFPWKTQQTGSIFDWPKKLNKPVLI